VVDLAVGGRSLLAAVRVLPGQSDRTITLHLGYGRTRAGAASERGFNAYRLRASGALWHAPGVAIRATGERYPLAVTQGHFRLEGRRVVQSATLSAFHADPSIFSEEDAEHQPALFPVWAYEGRAWGMIIDNGACTGCNACVAACQAENNIPVVGKNEVLRGREMHWLRVDRYYEGPLEDPVMHNEPMMCVHCEAAPCEYVCPVGATTHSSEGLNEMTYNRCVGTRYCSNNCPYKVRRCVGTRYCSNNCPYKVRRFNFFNYNGDVPQSLRLQKNPDVTVRTRGVMEKCTYCVQRINAARIDAEREGRPVRDGEIVTACQQACPTGAILFGDLNDPSSRVRRFKADPRSFHVLGDLNTRPRTSHFARIVNPNPEIEGAEHG
jgi:molybdopterin-containing oxidoreductase family iron-sulfur binding subunit